jgi:hypothetical protein
VVGDGGVFEEVVALKKLGVVVVSCLLMPEFVLGHRGVRAAKKKRRHGKGNGKALDFHGHIVSICGKKCRKGYT